jgi:hypothetical protein
MRRRLEEFDGDELRVIAREMMADIAKLGRDRQEDERRLDNQRRALALIAIDTIEAWLDCHPDQPHDTFAYSADLHERLLWLFSLAQSIRDREETLARPPRWSFQEARRAAIERFHIFGGKL